MTAESEEAKKHIAKLLEKLEIEPEAKDKPEDNR